MFQAAHPKRMSSFMYSRSSVKDEYRNSRATNCTGTKQPDGYDNYVLEITTEVVTTALKGMEL